MITNTRQVVYPEMVRAGSAFLSCVLSGLLLTHCSGDAIEAATIRVTEQVVLENPLRLGINIGGSAYYDDQQVAANPLSHGGFAKGRQTGLVHVGKATEDTVVDAEFDAADPDRISESFAGGRYCIATGARAGEAGAISAHDPASGVFTLQHAGAPLAQGDLVWIIGPETRRANPDPAEGERGIGIGDFRVAVGEGVSLDYVDAEDIPLDQCLRLSFPANGQRNSGGVKHYIRATPDTAYKVRIRARSEATHAELRVGLQNQAFKYDEPGADTEMLCPDPQLTPEWREYIFSGHTTEDARIGDSFSAITIGVSVDAESSGGPAFIDSIVLDDGKQSTGSGFNRFLVERLKEARCGVLRFYGAADLGNLAESFTAANATEAGWNYLSLLSHYRFNTVSSVVDEWMRLALEAAAQPWITVGSANTPEDWYSLVSYLAAPAGFDDASKCRAAHGQAEPWTASFDTIFLEIGNEWWNPMFRPFHTHDAAKYGQLCSVIIQRVRSHPHFDDKKIRLTIGGWAVNAHHWNGLLDRAADGHALLSIAPYLLHELNDYPSPGAMYRALFTDVDAYAAYGGLSTLEDLKKNGKGTRLAVYELNTHVTGGKVSPEAASELCSSAGAGIAVLDQAMSVMGNFGANPVNYFTALQRAYDGRAGLWGNFVRQNSGELRARPVWHGLRLANQYLIEGDMVAVEVSGGETWEQPENGSVPEMDDVPCLHGYAFLVQDKTASKRRVNLLLINRDVERWQYAKVQLPFAPQPKVQRAALKAASPLDNNEVEEKVTLTADEIDAASLDELSLPPCSAYVYRFVEQ